MPHLVLGGTKQLCKMNSPTATSVRVKHFAEASIYMSEIVIYTSEIVIYTSEVVIYTPAEQTQHTDNHRLQHRRRAPYSVGKQPELMQKWALPCRSLNSGASNSSVVGLKSLGLAAHSLLHRPWRQSQSTVPA